MTWSISVLIASAISRWIVANVGRSDAPPRAKSRARSWASSSIRLRRVAGDTARRHHLVRQVPDSLATTEKPASLGEFRLAERELAQAGLTRQRFRLLGRVGPSRRVRASACSVACLASSAKSPIWRLRFLSNASIRARRSRSSWSSSVAMPRQSSRNMHFDSVWFMTERSAGPS